MTYFSRLLATTAMVLPMTVAAVQADTIRFWTTEE